MTAHKKYIVTGGAGFVGSHLVDRLVHEGHNVTILDNFVTGSSANLSHLVREPRVELVECDVSESFPDIGRVDGVFHLASPASPRDFVPLAIPTMKVGSFGTFNALEYAKQYEAWFLMASTSEVYGDPLIHPQVETYFGNVNPIGVRGVYDEAKRFSEALVMAFHRSYSLRTSIVRIFNTYGPRMRPDDGRVVSNFICQALTSSPLTIYGDGSQTRSFCFVDDLVEGLFQFSIKKPIEPINLGNNQEYKVIDIAQKILSLIPESKSQMINEPLPENDPKVRRPDLARSKTYLEWLPKVSLEEGLKKTIDYFRSKL